MWIAVAVTAVVLSAGFIGLSQALGRDTERLIGQMSVLLPPAVATLERPAPPVEPAPVDTAQIEVVSEFLADEIDEGLVSVFQDANTITVRMKGAGMFASGSATVKEAFHEPIERVAQAANSTSGPIIIAGHSDNVPIRSSRYGSNQALSLARAQSVLDLVAPKVEDPGRLRAEGRADKEPIASNDTAEGRAANRRIEFIFVRQGVEQ